MPTLDEYPDVVIQEIAKRLDYSTIREMKLVNRSVYATLSDPLLWIDLCERDHRIVPSRAFRKGLAKHALNDENCFGKLDFERIWVKDPFRSNLVPPMLPSIETMKRDYGWTFTENSWTRMIVEEIPSDEHPEISRCIATSHSWGGRLVTIDLVKEGVPEWLLDHVRPRIVVSEMVRPRFDCASVYRMLAQLLEEGEDANGRGAPLQRCRAVERTWPQWDPAKWERVEVEFDGYPAGMRKIAVGSEGKDKQYWRGNYGAKFANLQIRTEMPEEFRWLSAEEADGNRERRQAMKRPADSSDTV
ncbi:hypothetical protein PFISCL1PPCAC_25894 [Pristionchus fissidentatus]|uniref:F-box domain-containing protein n=1 Tax=Pristionchus fissidentatus TaxID=1538716 RepID=A0AAV5WRF5_9BILA|nr:hypothetical protein PFISCL1PPCAC_25894 [Pristionchus fissidentatus]